MKKSNSEYLYTKITELIYDAVKNNNIVNKDIATEELFSLCKKDDTLYKYKNIYRIAIYQEENTSDIVILLASDFPYEDKDTIKINEKLVECIGSMEKIFIYLDNIDIHRKSERNKHYVLVKILKKDYKSFLKN